MKVLEKKSHPGSIKNFPQKFPLCLVFSTDKWHLKFSMRPSHALCYIIWFSTHELSLTTIWEALGFNSLLTGSILVMCVCVCYSDSSILLDGGSLSPYVCRLDMIDWRPNRRPSQVSAWCPGHPQFKSPKRQRHLKKTQRSMTDRLMCVEKSMGMWRLEQWAGMERQR